MCVCVCVYVGGGGGDYSGEAIILNISVSRGVITRGRRLIEWRLIFKQIRCTILSHHDGTVSVNVI